MSVLDVFSWSIGTSSATLWTQKDGEKTKDISGTTLPESEFSDNRRMKALPGCCTIIFLSQNTKYFSLIQVAQEKRHIALFTCEGNTIFANAKTHTCEYTFTQQIVYERKAYYAPFSTPVVLIWENTSLKRKNEVKNGTKKHITFSC